MEGIGAVREVQAQVRGVEGAVVKWPYAFHAARVLSPEASRQAICAAVLRGMARMKQIGVRLPRSLHLSLRAVAEREGMSMNQFISSAVGEKLAALVTEDYLARAERGSSGAGRRKPRSLAADPCVRRAQRRGRAALTSRIDAIYTNLKP